MHLAVINCQPAEPSSRTSTRYEVPRASVIKRRYRNKAIHLDKGNDVCRVQYNIILSCNFTRLEADATGTIWLWVIPLNLPLVHYCKTATQ
jgi:hypothetical protein